MNFGLNEGLLQPLPTIWNILHLVMKIYNLPILELIFNPITPRQGIKTD
jgi:hypothetical protein